LHFFGERHNGVAVVHLLFIINCRVTATSRGMKQMFF